MPVGFAMGLLVGKEASCLLPPSTRWLRHVAITSIFFVFYSTNGQVLSQQGPWRKLAGEGNYHVA